MLFLKVSEGHLAALHDGTPIHQWMRPINPMIDASKRGLDAMTVPRDKLRGSVISKGDLLSPVGENEWEALSDTPRYTLEQLLAQCDADAPEM